jgi:Na+/proline symporter
MTATLLLISVKGTYDVGGLSTVIDRNAASGRLENLSFNLSPYERHTFWTLAIGGSTFWINTNCINQAFLQRYLSLPSMKAARQAMFIYITGLVFILGLCCYNGLLIYATYYNCDPLTTKLIKQKDELVPLFVMDILGNFRGIPGIFVAGVFSAALSSLSTGLNSLSAIVLEDFVKPFTEGQLSDRSTNYVMRGSVFIFGFIAVAMVFIVEKMGTVLQLSMSLGSITIGPLLGLFTMGVFIPWVNGTGALTGGISGMLTIAYICFRAQASIALGEINFPTKPTSIEGCDYDFGLNNSMTKAPVNWDEMDQPIHHMSYLYYTTVGTVISCVVGTIVSFLIGAQDPRQIDPVLIAPMLRKYFFNESKTGKEGEEMVTHEFELKDNHITSD